MDKCSDCAKEHEEGSAEWRDCQDAQFTNLVNDPTIWKFTILPDDITRIRHAHVRFSTEFKGIPDISMIRTLVSHQFQMPGTAEDGGPLTDAASLIQFWQQFTSDMPKVMKRANLTHSLDSLWQENKIAMILKGEDLPYMDWERQETTIALKSPDSLEQGAAKLRELERDGFALYHFEVTDDVAEYYFRRGQVVRNQSSVSITVAGGV